MDSKTATMNMHRHAATLLLAALSSTATLAQEASPRPNESPSRTETPTDAARRAAQQEARTHSYGLFARNDSPATTRTREEVLAELMEARAAETPWRRKTLSSN